MDDKNLKIEIAKSWFILAQLTMILAGFLLAGGGIAMTNSQESLYSSHEVISDGIYLMNFKVENMELLAQLNLSNGYQELIDAQINLSRGLINSSKSNIDYAQVSLYVGFFLVVFSIVFFSIGDFLLHRINKK